MWDVLVLIPDHCLSIYFSYHSNIQRLQGYISVSDKAGIFRRASSNIYYDSFN